MGESTLNVARLRAGPTPEKYKKENISNPQVMADILHKTADLCDEAFEDLVNDIGYRAALLVLRDKALSADVKALDLYFRLIKETRSERKRARPAGKDETPSTFLQSSREEGPLPSEETSNPVE